jgi:hypothetical protein
MSYPLNVPVAFKSRSSDCYLDGRSKDGSAVLMTNQNPNDDQYLHWRIESEQAGIYCIRSISSNCYLDGRDASGKDVLVSNRYPFNDPNLQWNIINTGDANWIVL